MVKERNVPLKTGTFRGIRKQFGIDPSDMRSGRLFGLCDASTDPVTRRGAPGMADDLNWRDRVAHAAAEEVGRAGDEETISQARRVVEI